MSTTPLHAVYEAFLQCHGASIDSRTIQPGQLFIALQGSAGHGKHHAHSALERGARYVLTDDAAQGAQEHFLYVENTLETLQQLAHMHRCAHNIPVIAVTGSNGKTTTKNLLACVLATTYRVSATQGNLNNHIGLALTLLNIDKGTEVAILEMGANQPGDIAQLCAIAAPSHGIVTNIARAHLEGFGSLAEVAHTKLALFRYLQEHHGQVYVHLSDPILQQWWQQHTIHPAPIGYTSQGQSSPLQLVAQTPYLRYQSLDKTIYDTHLIGKHNLCHIASALVVADSLHVPRDQAHHAISNYIPNNNRCEVRQYGTNTVLLDAYNANPDSMLAALDMLHSFSAPKKVLVLGDMLELGPASLSLHQEIVHKTREGSYDKVLLLGTHMSAAAHLNPQALHFGSKHALVDYLQAHPIQGSTVLIKGSRLWALETLAELFS